MVILSRKINLFKVSLLSITGIINHKYQRTHPKHCTCLGIETPGRYISLIHSRIRRLWKSSSRFILITQEVAFLLK
jgi:hypothetical protein